MAEDLNGYFGSVFTREDISSLLVADAKFQEAKSDCLEQLTNGNSRTNQYTTCKSVQLVITSC